MPAGLYTRELTPLVDLSESPTLMFPCSHPAYFLSTVSDERGPRIAVHSMLDRRKLLALDPATELQIARRERNDGATYRRVYFFPNANRLITIPRSDDRLVIRELNILEALDKAGVDYLFVTSVPVRTAVLGTPYRYQLDVKAKRGGVTYKLDSGPNGMAISKDGELTWTVPADFSEQKVGVIISAKDAIGQEILHAFTIQVRDRLN